MTAVMASSAVLGGALERRLPTGVEKCVDPAGEASDSYVMLPLYEFGFPHYLSKPQAFRLCVYTLEILSDFMTS